MKLQREADPSDELIFSIVGWHALTLPQDPKALQAARMDMVALMLAVGIDPKRSIVFHQDHVCRSQFRSSLRRKFDDNPDPKPY